MSWIEHRSDIDVEIAECYSQIEKLHSRIAFLKSKQKEEDRLINLAKSIGKRPRCHKCVYEMRCAKDKDNEQECPNYRRDATDGGYYG